MGQIFEILGGILAFEDESMDFGTQSESGRVKDNWLCSWPSRIVL